jgi:hypothetical protein
MQTYIILLPLFVFASVPVCTALQEVPNAAKVIADIHQTLPNSCVFIMNSEAQQQGENNLI